MMESSAISLRELQGEEFTMDNENEDVKGNWVLSITQKIRSTKNSSFN